ncbi:hypothetical protein QTP88_009837 [Uroleucon formosanum]
MSTLPKSLNEASEQLRNLQIDNSFMYKNQQFIHAPPNEQFNKTTWVIVLFSMSKDYSVVSANWLMQKETFNLTHCNVEYCYWPVGHVTSMEISEAKNPEQSWCIYEIKVLGGNKTYMYRSVFSFKCQNLRQLCYRCATKYSALSGIAAMLLHGGKTAHSAFKLPLNLNIIEIPTRNIIKQSNMANVLKKCKLIVWDESPMSHKKVFEALNNCLKDLRNSNLLMGGVTVLIAGDFRQTLPIVPRGTRANEIAACIKSSYLWPKIEKCSLTKNMPVNLKGYKTAEQFSKLLLKIGDGKYPKCEKKLLCRQD